VATRDRFQSGGGITLMGMRTVVRITMQLNEVDWMAKGGENDWKTLSLEEKGVHDRSFSIEIL
jgi:hypothetical protein